MDQRKPAEEAIYQTKKCCYNDPGNKVTIVLIVISCVCVTWFCASMFSLHLFVVQFTHKRIGLQCVSACQDLE